MNPGDHDPARTPPWAPVMLLLAGGASLTLWFLLLLAARLFA